MKRWAGVGGMVVAACGPEPPPAVVMVPAPMPPASAEPVPTPIASAPPSAPTAEPEEATETAEPAKPAASSLGRLSSNTGTAPTLRQGAVTVTGKLPPEVVQRIVRQNFGRFRLCYENGLRTNASLAGRITVKFTIDGGGVVRNVTDGGSSLPDKGVIACVTRGFTNLSFPQPASGTVTVLYPIVFAP